MNFKEACRPTTYSEHLLELETADLPEMEDTDAGGFYPPSDPDVVDRDAWRWGSTPLLTPDRDKAEQAKMRAEIEYARPYLAILTARPGEWIPVAEILPEVGR